VECHSGLDRTDHTFDPVAGGVLCPECVNNYGTDQSWNVSVSALIVLRFFQRSLNSKLQSGSAGPYVDDLADVKAFLRIYMRYIAERDLKSTGFLDLVRFKETH
jgi:recombinational DNA repair protein (RecF pathway)